MRIGVFDSGIGGKSVVIYLKKKFPKYDVLFINDHDNVPYGNKTNEEILKLTDNSIKKLVNDNCDIIVIACNTATAVAIDYLRRKYSNVKFVGCEPMIKTAVSATKNKIVSVLGTNATIRSQRYNNLKIRYGNGVRFIEPDCSDWATMIENNNLDTKKIIDTIEWQIRNGSDVIVLACTHYHWIEPLIKNIVAGRATVLNPSEAIARRVNFLIDNKKTF